ncbi:MAG: hypothetical protein KDD45_09375, partial [Bdellovibrionales bacterium]|nr:hypothetical protein [Bdellovibrionales bacterium]
MKSNQSVVVKYYKPTEVFKLSRKQDDPMYGYELAKGFYNARYDDQGNTSSVVVRAGDFTSNAGAAQLFDKETMEPTKNIGVFSYVSIPVYWKEESGKQYLTFEWQKDQLTTYGHSERICMYDLLDSYNNRDQHDTSERICMKNILDSYMKFKQIDCHDLSNPSHSDNIRDQNAKVLEVLRSLTNNASNYQSFLTKSTVVVKMWSEREPCKYTTPLPGGECSKFIEDICPMGSKYGYIAETRDITALNAEAYSKAIAERVKQMSKFLIKAYFENEISQLETLMSGITITSETDIPECTAPDTTPSLGKLQNTLRENPHDVLPNNGKSPTKLALDQDSFTQEQNHNLTGGDESEEKQKANMEKLMLELQLSNKEADRQRESSSNCEDDQKVKHQLEVTGVMDILGGENSGCSNNENSVEFMSKKSDYEQGYELYGQKKYQEAIVSFEKAVLSKDPILKLNANYYSGQCYYALKKYMKSTTHFGNVVNISNDLKITPEISNLIYSAYHYKGNALYALKKYGGAIK